MKQSNSHSPEESKKLLNDMDVAITSQNLVYYADHGSITEVTHLINIGIHPDSSHEGNIPIIRASQNGHLNIVEILLDKGANPNLLNSNKCSALSLAAEYGHNIVVGLLIKKGANINGSSEENFIPIIQALEGNHLNVIETLVSNGVNVEIRDNEGNKPLTIAHKSNNNMAYDKLVSLGATPLTDEEKKQTQFFPTLLDDLKEIYSKKHYIFLTINVLCFIVFIFVINEDTGGGLFSRLIGFLVCVAIGGLIGRFIGGKEEGSGKEWRIKGFIGGGATLLIFVTIIMWSNNNYVPSSGGRSSNTCSHCGDSFSGKGWSSISGEQFKCNDRQCIYCSSSCAYDSQSLKWKLSN